MALCVWLVGWFQARWNSPTSAVTARAARGSYAAYLVHPLILVTLSAAARSLPWPPEAKFLVVAVVGVPSCFVVGYLLTRVRGLKKVL